MIVLNCHDGEPSGDSVARGGKPDEAPFSYEGSKIWGGSLPAFAGVLGGGSLPMYSKPRMCARVWRVVGERGGGTQNIMCVGRGLWWIAVGNGCPNKKQRALHVAPFFIFEPCTPDMKKV